jgi:hypothetical protein
MTAKTHPPSAVIVHRTGPTEAVLDARLSLLKGNIDCRHIVDQGENGDPSANVPAIATHDRSLLYAPAGASCKARHRPAGLNRNIVRIRRLPPDTAGDAIMTEFDPGTGHRRDSNSARSDRGGLVSLLIAAALLVVAFAMGLFLYSTARRQMASTDNAAPSLTTGAATSKPNTTGVTPPASR